jgi:hypothetical protein
MTNDYETSESDEQVLELFSLPRQDHCQPRCELL